MKKLFPIISVLCLVWSGSAYSKIIFRALCENPEGVSFSRSIAHLNENKVINQIMKKINLAETTKLKLFMTTIN
jgi:hypothetical protein